MIGCGEASTTDAKRLTLELTTPIVEAASLETLSRSTLASSSLSFPSDTSRDNSLFLRSALAYRIANTKIRLLINTPATASRGLKSAVDPGEANSTHSVVVMSLMARHPNNTERISISTRGLPRAILLRRQMIRIEVGASTPPITRCLTRILASGLLMGEIRSLTLAMVLIKSTDV
jgi:hypothetical protein